MKNWYYKIDDEKLGPITEEELLRAIEKKELTKDTFVQDTDMEMWMKASSVDDLLPAVSGEGKNSIVPSEIKGWSWGAFLLNWVWGIGNSTYIALLMFVPLVNIVMLFVLGAKGNEWAWKNRTWRDVEHFKKTQQKWAITGVVLVCVVTPLFAFSIFSMLKGEAYDQSLVLVRSNVEVVELVGEPIESGYFVTGSIQYNGDKGNATLYYNITGSKKEAKVYILAHKNREWILDRVIVYSDGGKRQIDLIKEMKKQ
ncbi:MAG TPA: DUF4339 domain-containing protein [Sulfurospirillum arcachonense]|nr:DUF4339 domain-containing protein [Sulfurospirillum arcachonense]